MKRIFAYIILSVLSVTVVCAAPSKRLTKRYKGARMEVVLQDLAKATGYKLNIAPEVNVDVPVYANFKEASPKQVLSKILDSNIQYTIIPILPITTRQLLRHGLIRFIPFVAIMSNSL